MVSKMRGFLTPSIKCEVDYEEALKDVCNVLMYWQKGEAAGKRAFIPDVKYHGNCYAALRIFLMLRRKQNLSLGSSAKNLEKMASTCTMISPKLLERGATIVYHFGTCAYVLGWSVSVPTQTSGLTCIISILTSGLWISWKIHGPRNTVGRQATN